MHRLGSGEADAQEIKSHPFFHEISWTDLEESKLAPPWVPNVANSLDTSLFDQEFTSMLPIGMCSHCCCFKRQLMIFHAFIVSPDVRDAYFGSLDKAFEGFTFVDDSAAQYMSRNGHHHHHGASSSSNR